MSKKRNRRNYDLSRAASAQISEVPAPSSSSARPAILWGLACLAFFLFLHFMNTPYLQGISLVTGLLILVGLILRSGRMSNRLTWPAIFLILYVCMDAIASLHTVSGSQALPEFLTVWYSFCVFLAILMFAHGEGEQLGRRSAMLLESCAALTSLVSIDLISTRILSTLFLSFMSLFEPAFSTFEGVEVGVRITSVLGNPNIFAGFVGIGVLLSLGLATTEPDSKWKTFHLVCLAWNALGFVLAFSMGASGMIVVAFLVYLLLEQQRRSALLLLMVETLVLTLVAAFPIYLTSFQSWSGFQPIPLCAAILVAVVLCLADRYFGSRVTPHLITHRKTTLALCGGVLAAVILYAVLALNLTGSISLHAEDSLRRAAYPDPGSYTLQLESSGACTVTIESQSEQQAMMHLSSTLYSGPAQGAEFQVPEDSLVVYFNFTASEDTKLISARYQGDGGSGEIKLGYPLLPGFVANRLQGLFANENAIQRTVFFLDGMKLFARSPIIGLGLGAFSNSYASVQSFYYTTNYVHNHYIQVLLETGLVGLFLFGGLLISSFIAILRTRKMGDAAHPLTACLGAALVFMAGHAAVEVVFSSHIYLPLAFGVFALISLCCGNSLPLPGRLQAAQKPFFRVLAGLMGIYCLLLGGSSISQLTISQLPSYQNYSLGITLDRFNRSTYMMAYVYNACFSQDTPDSVMEQAWKYAKELEESQDPYTCYSLACAYFAAGETDSGMRMLQRYISLAPSRPNTWTNVFTSLTTDLPEGSDYQAEISEMYQQYQTWNEQNLGMLQVDTALLAQVQSLIE